MADLSGQFWNSSVDPFCFDANFFMTFNQIGDNANLYRQIKGFKETELRIRWCLWMKAVAPAAYGE